MLNKFLTLLKYESKVLIKTHHIHTNLSLVFLISNFAAFIVFRENMHYLCTPLFVIVFLPTILIIIHSNIIKKGLDDGGMDFLILTYSRYTILFAKLISLFLFPFIALILYILILIFFFSLKLSSALILLFCGSVICLQASSLALVVAIKRSSIFLILAPSFLILTMMICGFLYYDPQVILVYVILGIVLLNLMVVLGIKNHLISRS